MSIVKVPPTWDMTVFARLASGREKSIHVETYGHTVDEAIDNVPDGAGPEFVDDLPKGEVAYLRLEIRRR